MSTISQKLDFRQSQNLVMTPQLQQAIKLLQLNNVELNEFIESEIAQNPLLEKDDSPQEGAADAGEHTDTPAPERDTMRDEFDQSWTGNENDAPQPAGGELADFDAGSSMANIGAGGNRSFDVMEEGFESRLSQQATLRDHLLDQLKIAVDDERMRMIGALLIDQLDESGYLRADLSDLAARLGVPEEKLQALLSIMRGFDPTGIFARDLSDCLSLQLDEQGRLDAPMQKLLSHLPMIAARDFAKLAQVCGVNETYLEDMIADIRALNPRPASNFDHFIVQTVIPDVLMKKLPNHVGGGWRVELNSETLPRVLVNQSYYTEVAKVAREKKDKDYLNQQLNTANWLVKALDQRAKTILKVAGEIIEQQEGFFLFGIEYLRPLTLKDIAEKVEMHESTISRVTTNKFIGTPRGVFELKFFFSTALGSGDNTHSAEAVKARIKTMIDAESADDILSDDAIMEKLGADGITLARRTVAKYREALHIPSSVQRRKEKRTGR